MQSDAAPIMAHLAHVLGHAAFRFSSESELHEGVASVLRDEGIEFAREWSLGQGDRVDFFVDGVALEIKTEGSRSALLRQLHRYAMHPHVQAVVLASTRRLHCAAVPARMNGKLASAILLNGTVL